MPPDNKPSRDRRIYNFLNPYRQRSWEQFQVQHVFSRDPKKISTVAQRGGSVIYAEKFTGKGSVMGITNDLDPKHIEKARVACISDTIVTDDPVSAIPYLKISWFSHETDDLAILHRLFSKVRSK